MIPKETRRGYLTLRPRIEKTVTNRRGLSSKSSTNFEDTLLKEKFKSLCCQGRIRRRFCYFRKKWRIINLCEKCKQITMTDPHERDGWNYTDEARFEVEYIRRLPVVQRLNPAALTKYLDKYET